MFAPLAIFSPRKGTARAGAQIREGNSSLHEGDLAGALKAYNAAIEADPENAFAWNNKGVVLENLGRSQEALRCHNRAIKVRRAITPRDRV